ncbi:MAG: class II aldolase/adducin family protein [Alphaproteobacteria bacterium]|nr:class II aldolase/adducin family protein [Alphaproteobacteria bacterium]
MNHLEARREIIAACIDMNRRGLNQGVTGNISVRVPEGFLITPSGMDYGEMQPEDMVVMHLDGSYEGARRPSSEWRFHRDIMVKRPEVGAVTHMHSMFAATISCLRKDIPAIHYMIVVAGGNSIRCAPYHLYGTQALADAALAALEGRSACLLANHGMIVLGPNLKKAMWLAVEVENLAAQYWRALQIGEPYRLTDEEIAAVVQQFKSYGQGGAGETPRCC